MHECVGRVCLTTDPLGSVRALCMWGTVIFKTKCMMRGKGPWLDGGFICFVRRYLIRGLVWNGLTRSRFVNSWSYATSMLQTAFFISSSTAMVPCCDCGAPSSLLHAG